MVGGTQEEGCFVVDVPDGDCDTRFHFHMDVELTLQCADNGSHSGRPSLQEGVKATWSVRGFLFFIAKSCYMV